MESKEIQEHLDFMFRTTKAAARSVGQQLLPAIEEAHQELTKILMERRILELQEKEPWQKESRAAQIERLRKL